MLMRVSVPVIVVANHFWTSVRANPVLNAEFHKGMQTDPGNMAELLASLRKHGGVAQEKLDRLHPDTRKKFVGSIDRAVVHNNKEVSQRLEAMTNLAGFTSHIDQKAKDASENPALMHSLRRICELSKEECMSHLNDVQERVQTNNFAVGLRGDLLNEHMTRW